MRNQKLIESLLQSQENPKSDSPKQVGRFKIPAGWRLLPLAKCHNQEETPYLSLSFKRRKVPFIHIAPHIFQWRYTEAWFLSWHSWKSVVPAQYSCPGKNKDSGLSWQTPLLLFPAQHRVDRQKMIFSASPWRGKELICLSSIQTSPRLPRGLDSLLSTLNLFQVQHWDKERCQSVKTEEMPALSNAWTATKRVKKNEELGIPNKGTR